MVVSPLWKFNALILGKFGAKIFTPVCVKPWLHMAIIVFVEVFIMYDYKSIDVCNRYYHMVLHMRACENL